MNRLAIVLIVSLAAGMLPGAAAETGAPALVSGPSAVRDGGRARISFSASAPTDVEVAVLDAKGRVVRHLAAGLLGPNAPEPLKKDRLSQELFWDGKDDLGRPAQDGPFRVRVGLGLHPAFDGLIGFRPEALGGVRSLATGPDGSVYVFHCYGSSHPYDGSTWEHTAPNGLVYRLGWGDERPEAFGRDLGLKEPVSVAVERQRHRGPRRQLLCLRRQLLRHAAVDPRPGLDHAQPAG